MKKLVTSLTIASSLLMTSPAFAYTVQPGDSLSQIANKENITLSQLEQLNPQIVNPNLIFPGDVIKTTVAATNVNAPYSASDLDLLSRLVEAEAGGEIYAGKVAVAETVMNRVASPIFPNTIHGVIYQPGQFSPVANGWIDKPASAESIAAAKQVLSSYKPNPNGILYYYAPAKTTNAWIRSLPIAEVIGNQVFCY